MSDIGKDVYIHIGYPKTATTTLQSFVFPFHSELLFLRSYLQNSTLLKELSFARENYIQRNKKLYHSQIAEAIQLATKSNSLRNSKIVYSEESLLSFSMFFRFDPLPYVWTVDPCSVARKIKTVFGECPTFEKTKIIVTIRKQEDMITSMYAQVYNFVFRKFRETNSFTKFYEYLFGKGGNGFMLDALFYHDVISQYVELFGRDNVKVLVFEQLYQQPDAYWDSLSQFMGVSSTQTRQLALGKKANSRRTGSGLRTDERRLEELLTYYRLKWPLLNNTLSQLSFLRPFYGKIAKITIPGKIRKDICLDGAQKEKIRSTFSENNKKLSAEFDLKLDKYGYF